MLERGAVEGEVFHRGAVQALGPRGRPCHAPPRDARPQAAHPARYAAVYSDEDGFRFRHLLIRDAAYDSLPKATRAELHERFATWLEQHGGSASSSSTRSSGTTSSRPAATCGSSARARSHGGARRARATRHLAAAGCRAIARARLPARLRSARARRRAVFPRRRLRPPGSRSTSPGPGSRWALAAIGFSPDFSTRRIAGAIEAGDRPRELGHRFDRAALQARLRGVDGRPSTMRSRASPPRRYRCSRRPVTTGGCRLCSGRSLSPSRTTRSWADVVGAAERVVTHARRAGRR